MPTITRSSVGSLASKKNSSPTNNVSSSSRSKQSKNVCFEDVMWLPAADENGDEDAELSSYKAKKPGVNSRAAGKKTAVKSKKAGLKEDEVLTEDEERGDQEHGANKEDQDEDEDESYEGDESKPQQEEDNLEPSAIETQRLFQAAAAQAKSKPATKSKKSNARNVKAAPSLQDKGDTGAYITTFTASTKKKQSELHKKIDQLVHQKRKEVEEGLTRMQFILQHLAPLESTTARDVPAEMNGHGDESQGGSQAMKELRISSRETFKKSDRVLQMYEEVCGKLSAEVDKLGNGNGAAKLVKDCEKAGRVLSAGKAVCEREVKHIMGSLESDDVVRVKGKGEVAKDIDMEAEQIWSNVETPTDTQETETGVVEDREDDRGNWLDTAGAIQRGAKRMCRGL